MTVLDLGDVDPESFFTLYNMLECIPIRIHPDTNRVGFGKHRNACFGLVKSRQTKKVGLSAYSRAYPEIWQELKRVGSIFPNFTFTSVHLNKNVVCGKHRDKGNVGNSIIVSFGDYTGGDLYAEDGEHGEANLYNTNCRAVLFNGKAIPHWTTDITSGTKYSLVFYTHECAI